MAAGPAGVAAVAAGLTDQLRAAGDLARAAHDQGYLKSEYEHLGVAVPKVRSIAKAFVRGQQLDHATVVALVDELWTGAIYDRRGLGAELVLATPKLWSTADLPWIERLVRDSHTWALVDGLATIAVGRIVVADPAALDVLDRWVHADDFWVRRTAVLGLRDVAKAGREWARFERYADLLLDEREFFIRKALGWVAREVGRLHPELVSPWVRANLGRMSGVTFREAVKYLPDGAELTAAWKAR
jgi:3-methyladenine DNA glycosylase AlkD